MCQPHSGGRIMCATYIMFNLTVIGTDVRFIKSFITELEQNDKWSKKHLVLRFLGFRPFSLFISL